MVIQKDGITYAIYKPLGIKCILIKKLDNRFLLQPTKDERFNTGYDEIEIKRNLDKYDSGYHDIGKCSVIYKPLNLACWLIYKHPVHSPICLFPITLSIKENERFLACIDKIRIL